MVTIDILPDDALLEIFILYLEEAYKADSVDRLEAWRTLVHVCQRWRGVVFASPCCLNLRLVCTSRKPVKKMLGIWPTLPIVIQDLDLNCHRWVFMGNILAALEHRDRVCQIALKCNSHLEWDPVMMESFPNLTHLFLHANHPFFEIGELPDSFLAGSAPQLRELVLDSIPFPALPKLLLSTDNLVELKLWNTPHSGYISPEAMATCLSPLTSLKVLSLGFPSHDSESHPDESSRCPPSLTRIDLPALLKFQIHGANEYIEDFVAQINAPLLFDIDISCSTYVPFDMSQLSQFLDRIENFKALHQARVQLCEMAAHIKFANSAYTATLEFQLPSLDAGEQPWHLTELCRSFTFPISPSVERLDIVVDPPLPRGWYNHWYYIGNNIWLELLQPFTAVKDLYLSKGLALRVLCAMQELIEENATQGLPALRNIFVEGHDLSGAVHAAIGPFIAVRQNSGHHVTVCSWDRRQEEALYTSHYQRSVLSTPNVP